MSCIIILSVKIDPPFALMTKEEGQPPCQGKEGLSDKVKKPPATYGSTSR